MFSASYRFTHGIRTCAGAPESSPGCDQILLTNRTLPEPALQDLACPCGIAGLARRARFRRCTASCRCGVSSAKDDQRESAAETRHPRRSLQAGRPPERGRLHRDHRLLQLLSFLTAGSFPVVKPLPTLSGITPSCQFSVLRQFLNDGPPVLSQNNRALNVAHSRFVARSPQVMMESYGRGHLHSGRAEIAKASKAARLDAGPDGRAIRTGRIHHLLTSDSPRWLYPHFLHPTGKLFCLDGNDSFCTGA